MVQPGQWKRICHTISSDLILHQNAVVSKQLLFSPTIKCPHLNAFLFWELEKSCHLQKLKDSPCCTKRKHLKPKKQTNKNAKYYCVGLYFSCLKVTSFRLSNLTYSHIVNSEREKSIWKRFLTFVSHGSSRLGWPSHEGFLLSPLTVGGASGEQVLTGTRSEVGETHYSSQVSDYFSKLFSSVNQTTPLTGK